MINVQDLEIAAFLCYLMKGLWVLDCWVEQMKQLHDVVWTL